MSDAYHSADLILKLYDLRREPTMRQARQWFITFNPDTADDMIAVMRSGDSAYFRMVTSFWDMAAAFVNNGAIDEKIFNDSNAEHIVVFAKVEPLLADYRAKMQAPTFLVQLEQLAMRLPNAKERLAATRERFRAMAAARR